MLYYNRVLQDEDKTGMDELNMAKKRLINNRSIKRRISNDDYRVNTLMSSNYKNTVDPKLVEENVKSIKVLYNKNIDLMIKLKNTFTQDTGGAPPPIPASMIPLPPPPVAAIIPAAPPPAPPIPPPPPMAPPPPAAAAPAYMPVALPPAAAAAPAAFIGPAPAPVVAPSGLTGLAAYFGFLGGPPAPPAAGAGRRSKKGYRGGVLKVVEKYGIGTDIITLIDQIQRIDDLIKEQLYLLFPTIDYISFKSFNEIIALHNKFYLMFNADIVPYHPSQVSVPMVPSLSSIDFMEIIDRLNTLYVVYSNEFASNLIPKLINTYNTSYRE